MTPPFTNRNQQPPPMLPRTPFTPMQPIRRVAKVGDYVLSAVRGVERMGM